MQIELSQEELDLIKELLDRANSELREEVYKTEATEWKQALKARQQVLDTLRVRLQPK